MLFRLLLIIVLFYLVRTLVRWLFAPRDRIRIMKDTEKTEELDLSQYEIEDAEYHDLEDE